MKRFKTTLLVRR